MELVPGFILLVQGLSSTMTAPTFASLTTVLAGWVFAGRRTVTRMILAAGSMADKHYSSYHRLFSAARWSLDAVGLAVFALVEPWLGDVVMLRLDDTLCRKRGLKMFGKGHASRSAALQPRPWHYELGPQLGRAGGDY
jgi:hypothetical protein